MDADASASLAEQVRSAIAGDAPLSIVGGGSKAFLGRPTQARPLHVGGHRGIVSYEPSELVVTARGGTPLHEVEAALGERGQMLAFEPPHFGDTDTLGGTVAAAQSGPRRPYAGAVRDFVLGVRLLDGKGEILSFGGQVMKNVAGYDLSRLMAGAMGTLGILLEVSLKVLPRPEREVTLRFELDAARAIAKMNEWARRPLPLSGAFHEGKLPATCASRGARPESRAPPRSSAGSAVTTCRYGPSFAISAVRSSGTPPRCGASRCLPPALLRTCRARP